MNSSPCQLAHTPVDQVDEKNARRRRRARRRRARCPSRTDDFLSSSAAPASAARRASAPRAHQPPTWADVTSTSSPCQPSHTPAGQVYDTARRRRRARRRRARCLRTRRRFPLFERGAGFRRAPRERSSRPSAAHAGARRDSAALPRRRRRRRPRCRHRRPSPSCERPLARHRHTPRAGRARTLTLLPSPSPHHPAFFTALHLAPPPPAVPLLSRPLSPQRANDPARPLAIAALAARRITHFRTARPSSQLLCSKRYPSPTAPADIPNAGECRSAPSPPQSPPPSLLQRADDPAPPRAIWTLRRVSRPLRALHPVIRMPSAPRPCRPPAVGASSSASCRRSATTPSPLRTNALPLVVGVILPPHCSLHRHVSAFTRHCLHQSPYARSALLRRPTSEQIASRCSAPRVRPSPQSAALA